MLLLLDWNGTALKIILEIHYSMMIIIVNVLVNNDERTTATKELHGDLPTNVIRRNSFFRPMLSRQQHQQQQLQRPAG